MGQIYNQPLYGIRSALTNNPPCLSDAIIYILPFIHTLSHYNDFAITQIGLYIHKTYKRENYKSEQGVCRLRQYITNIL